MKAAQQLCNQLIVPICILGNHILLSSLKVCISLVHRWSILYVFPLLHYTTVSSIFENEEVDIKTYFCQVTSFLIMFYNIYEYL